MKEIFFSKNIAGKSVIFLLILALALSVQAADYYVDASSGSDSNSGTSWQEAKASVSAAMSLVDGDDDIYVTQGTYYEKITFPVANNVRLQGGYISGGHGGSDPAEHHTIIDGTDLSTSQAMIYIPADGTTGISGIVIDGFQIVNGTNNDYGCAGIESYSLGLTIRRSRIIGNIATGNNGRAGGIYIWGALNDTGSPLIEHNIIMNNSAGGVGGIWLEGASGKSTPYSATIVNCVICDNSSTGTDDYSWNWGTGGIDVFYPANASIINCTIANNSAANPEEAAAGIHVSGLSGQFGSAQVTNSIIWHPSGDDIVVTAKGTIDLQYCDIEDADTGTEIIHADPFFALDTDYYLLADSPCIDSGTDTADGVPAVDIYGTHRPLYDGFDIGAYEYDQPIIPGPTFDVAGTVTQKSDSSSVVDAIVSCYYEDFDLSFSTTTDSNGFYNLTGLPQSEASITVHPDDSLAAAGRMLMIDQDFNSVDFSLAAGASIRGIVTDCNSAMPVSDVEVTFWNERNFIGMGAVTDSKGEFHLKNLPAGISELKIRPDVQTGYAWNLPWGSNFIVLNEGEERTLQMAAINKGAVVHAQLIDTNGNPVTDTEISYCGNESEGWGNTDQDGRLDIILSPGIYRISVDEDNCAAIPVEIEVDDITQTFDVNIVVYTGQNGQSISGTVNGLESKPEESTLFVTIFEAGLTIDANNWPTFTPVAEYELDVLSPQFDINFLPPGNYDIYLIEEYEDADELCTGSVIDSVNNIAAGTSVDLNYNTGCGELTGTVNDTQGNPVPGATVVLCQQTNGDFAGFADADANGTYIVRNLPAGNYIVNACHSKYTVQRENLSIDASPPSLISQWKLNDNAATAVVEDCIGTTEGTLHDGSSNLTSDHSVQGITNNALNFDGVNDYVDLGQLTLPYSLTISVWVKMDALPANNTFYGFFIGGAGGYDTQGIWLFNASGTLCLYYNVANSSTNHIVCCNKTFSWQPDQWYNIVVTQNTPTADPDIYINGQPIEYVYTGKIGNPTRIQCSFSIAKNGSYSGGYFNGLIDNVMLFDTALDSQKVLELYNAGIGVEEFFDQENLTTTLQTTGKKEAADLNGDGLIDISDISILANGWLQQTQASDFNGDGTVNFDDMSRIANCWLYKCLWQNGH